MEKIKILWDRTYYSELVLNLLLVVLLIVSIMNLKKHPQLRIFPIYIFSFILLKANIYSYYLLKGQPVAETLKYIHGYSDLIVTLLEFLAFIYFFMSVFNSRKRKVVTLIITILFYIASFLITIFNLIPDINNNYDSLTLIYILESFALLVPCFFYFQELFFSTRRVNPLEIADFWAASGITFYTICTLPTSFFLDYFNRTDYALYQQLFSIVNIFYIVLFAMMLKSYLCKPTQ